MRFQVPDRADPADVATVVQAVGTAEPRRGGVRIVAIDGLSGAGKTTLAAAVGAALGAPVLHMDSIYPGWDGLAESVGLLTTQVLQPLARCEKAAYRIWDWHRDGWNGTAEVPVCELLVIEGCGSSVGPSGEYAAVRVWVEAPVEVRRERGLARDGAAYRPNWERWAAQEAELFGRDGTRAKADLVVTTA